MTKRRRLTREDVSRNVRNLGVTSGDVLYVRASLGAIGRTSTHMKDAFLGGVQDVIGDDGIIIAPSFTRAYPVWKRNIPIHDIHTPPITGALSKIMLEHPGAVRSVHPTHSFVAVGQRAKEFMKDHRLDGACFEPIRRVIKSNGKMLLIGCAKESPGFSTVHLAQFDLGLSQKHFLRFAIHVRHLDKSGEPTFFHPIENPGCSKGFRNFYSDYLESGNLKTGYIGLAFTILVEAAEAYRVEYDRLRQDPKYPLCESNRCICCRVLRGYNLSAAPLALLRNAVHQLSRLASALSEK